MFNVQDMDCIWVNGHKFKGIGYQGLLTVNTKTYKERPSRADDGSMNNINDHTTFTVPRAKVNFKYWSIEEYQTLCAIICGANEFPVKYFDKQVGDFVTHYMYCEPAEMTKLWNVGTSVFGVLDYEISFIGTLNNLPSFTVNFYTNATSSDSSILSTMEDMKWDSSIIGLTASEVSQLASEQGISLPTGTTFKCWNTRRDGKGITYFPSIKYKVLSNLNLYAIWE